MDDDTLDGCQAVLDTTEGDDDLTASLRPLFPGDLVADPDELAAQWRELFGGEA